ncbi:hypothetical protein LUZ61_012965 [Rhynchospora tenuis]|uniref:NB-ARC domain-containing protein n=1 Tax=Rhynchospora tenuis TaxID=198213 RepID=A0AAD6A441_9POAL|nr:hypothetical protein LUZ61_012965 [Rhynchospora tenuis]
MALSTLAEWTGSGIINNLVDKAFSYLGEHLWPADTEAQLNRLKAALPKITAVMKVAEALKLKYPDSGMNAWLEQFKLAFLAAEDVLDELEYLELEDMVKIRDEVGSGSSSSSVVGSLKRKFHTSNIIKGDTLGRLREAVKLLNQASKDVGHFFQFASSLEICETGKFSSRETTSFLTESILGRETEKDMIIECLKKWPLHAHISAFSIVGAGGLGKTALAQLISDEMSRENEFDKIIWVCVSTIFSLEDITRKILEQLDDKKNYGGESLNALQVKLKKYVQSKKLLFILDDVWNEDKICDWEKLVAPLKFVQQGSKILLTTRMKSVAEILARVLNVELECLDLKGLDEQQLLLLLNKYAFNGYNLDNHKDLQKIGNRIVNKLWGSPLAAKVIGSLLNSNMNFYFWERILKCNSLINFEQYREVADVLKLSYYHLSADLQQCFRFCSIFPQDYEFEKNQLIRMWMASGFIRQQTCRQDRPEDIGEMFFNHLLRKSFLERRGKWYVMHDMMHELAQNVSEGECFRLNPDDISVNIPSTVQHVSVPDSEIKRVSHLRKLRTLVITKLWYAPSYKDRLLLPNDSLKETLRVLIIDTNFSYELPEGNDRLIHLRFLKANEGSGLLLSNSLYMLYHLQVLDLWYVFSYFIGSQITGLTNLVSLRYMNLPDVIMKKVHRVHKLTSLQELTFFVGQDSGFHIDELKTLNNLRHLCIKQIENVGDPIQAKNANLFEKESLLSLSLYWTNGSNSENPEEIIDNLQPHPNLKELEIGHYKGCPKLVPLHNQRILLPMKLQTLIIGDCGELDVALLESASQLNILATLHIVDSSTITSIPCSTNAFASLSELRIWGCDKLVQHSLFEIAQGVNPGNNMASLKIHDLSIPLSLLFIEPLRSLRFVRTCQVADCAPMEAMPEQWLIKNGSTLEWLNIKNANSLRSLPDTLVKLVVLKELDITNAISLEQIPELPPSLIILRIENASSLRSLPDTMVGLIVLKQLYISNAILLEQIPELPASLVELTIVNACSLQSLPYTMVKLTVLEQLSIWNATLLEHIPELPPSLIKFRIAYASSLRSLPDAMGQLTSLKELDITNATSLEQIPELPPSLVILKMENASLLQSLPDSMVRLSALEQLDIDAVSLPNTMVRLTALEQLSIWNATVLEQIPELPPCLVKLSIKDASSLRSLPDTMVSFNALEELYIDNASSLEQISVLPRSLVKLHIENAISLRSLPNTMVWLNALEEIYISNATSLEQIPDLPPSLIATSIEGAGGRQLF